MYDFTLQLKVSFLRRNPRVLHFIEEFKNHPCLWNPDHPKFDDEKPELRPTKL